MKEKLLVGLAACLYFLAMIGTAQALPTTYTDQGTFLAATGPLTLEDFESDLWVSNTSMPQGTTNLGVTWTSNPSLYVTTAAQSSGTNAISSVDTGFDLITATFATGVMAVGANIGMFNQPHDVEMTIYDAFDNILASYTLGAIAGFYNYGFVGFTSDTSIAKVEFLAAYEQGNDDFWVDDLYFGAQSVPEPATLLLLATGLVGIAGTGIRRKKLA